MIVFLIVVQTVELLLRIRKTHLANPTHFHPVTGIHTRQVDTLNVTAVAERRQHSRHLLTVHDRVESQGELGETGPVAVAQETNTGDGVGV
jgi:hypothetical protein